MTTQTMIMLYRVQYINAGKPQRAQAMSQADAESSAKFLRFQGAKHVRVCKDGYGVLA